MADDFDNHLGERKPRDHGDIHHEDRFLDLNTAPEEVLANLPTVGPRRAADICAKRPFRSWDDVEPIEGFDRGLVDDLKSGGAQLGMPRSLSDRPI